MTKGNNHWEVPAKLLVSIRYSALDDCRQLLLNGADVDQTFKINNQIKSAIHVAAELCSIDFVELLIEYGCSVDRLDSKGRTALHVAIEMGYEDIANYLILHKSDISLQDSCGQSPLHLAVKRGLIRIAKRLIQMGADVSRRNSTGRTPLSYISYSSTASYEMIKLLIDNGARVDDTDDEGNSILWHMLECGNYKYKNVELLIQNGARPDFMSATSRWAPIHLIILSTNDSKWKCLELMLKTGCGVNLETNEKQTPLHLSVQMQDVKSVEILLRAGANPNTVDCLGSSPLSHAVSSRGRGAGTGASSRIRKLVFTLINGGARMMLAEFETAGKHYFNSIEIQYFRQIFSNPMALVEQSRSAVWKLLGPHTFNWIDENRDRLPAILIQFVQFNNSTY